MATNVYTGNTGDFLNCKVLQKATLNYLDPIANSNKYYTIELHEGDNGAYRVFTEYGRIGATGRMEERVFYNISVATSEYEKIIRSKEKKGYVKIALAQSGTGSADAKKLVDVVGTGVTTKTPEKKKKKSKLDVRIQNFIRQIYEEAGNKINVLVNGSEKDVKGSPLGTLSIVQIRKGRDILQEIADIINNEKKYNYKDYHSRLIDLSTEFYRHIPKRFGRKVSVNDMLIGTLDDVSLQNDILTFYEDILKMDDIIYDDNINIDDKYKKLHCDIGILEKDDPEYIRIEKKVRDSESHHHRVHLSVKNIYTVKQHNAPEFDESIGNVRELFHGTRSANLPAILSTHLKLPKKLKGVYITGAMFGPGLYFASESTKSSQYSCSRFGGTTNKAPTSFIFVADVALGNIKKESSAKYYLEAPSGYDSVQGCKGSSLLHDEFIVYNENQQRLKYIVEFAPYRA